MIRKVNFRPLAENEILEAAMWYEDQRPGLGASFEEAISKAIRLIQNNPKQFRIVRQKDGLRQANTKQFPYRIFFTATANTIFVHAVVHRSRHDRHWMDR